MAPPPKPSEAASHAAASRLADFTGLDTESARTQLLPFLESFQDRDALRSHLKDLLGPGATQANFISQYIDSRFPPLSSKSSAAPSTRGGVASSSANPAASSVAALPHSQRSYAKQSRQPKASRSNAASKGAGADLDEAELEQVQAAFRAQEAQGTLYRKGAEDFYGGSSASGGGASFRSKGNKASSMTGSGFNSASASGRTTPTAFGSSSLAPHVSALSTTKSDAEQAAEAEAIAAAAAAAEDEALLAELPPTADMIAIDESIKLLSVAQEESTSGRAASTERRRCFCNGRMHPPHPDVPLCLSCGLIICTALLPSPLASTTSCPSCDASPLLDASNRSILLSRLAEKREALRDAQRRRALLLREERRMAREMRRETREKELFPELGGAGAAGAARAKKAATANVNQHQTARVFRIDKSGRGLTSGVGKREEGKKGKKGGRKGKKEREREGAAEGSAAKATDANGSEGDKVRDVDGATAGKGEDKAKEPASSTSRKMKLTLSDEAQREEVGDGQGEGEEREDEKSWPDGMRAFIDEDDDAFLPGRGRERRQ